jgi:DNA-binding MarR family transcriptional regulator
MAEKTPPAASEPARRRPAPAATPEALAAAPGYQVRRLYQAYLAAWTRSVDATLTGPQFAVLTAVDAAPGRDQSAMASAVALDTSTMADVARRLEGRGLLVRRTAPDDGRRKLLYLTEDGERVLRGAEARVEALDERLFAQHSGDERRRLLRELTDLADHWEGLSADA